MAPSPHEITQLLWAWSNGDQAALGKLMPLVYPQLRREARRFMAGERRDHSLQVTALVNEVYIRLIGSPEATWKERAQFFAFSAQLMRNILVDWARSRGAGKRGGGLILAELEEGQAVAPAPTVDLIDLDNAMNSLAAFDARKSRVVELRIFGGLSVAETAEVLKVSIDTVMRDMRLATTWLRRELKRKGRHGA